MGYHVTVLRTASGIQQPITEDEVRRAIIPMAGRLEVWPRAGEFWLYQPALGDESGILILQDGELWAKNPGLEFLELMIELAGHLGARVRGDEYESYRSLADVYIHPDDQADWDLAHPPEPRRLIKSRAVRALMQRVVVTIAGSLMLASVILLYRWLTG